MRTKPKPRHIEIHHLPEPHSRAQRIARYAALLLAVVVVLLDLFVWRP